MRWLVREIGDYLVAAWLIAGVAGILYLLADDLFLAVAALIGFVGGSLFVYYRLARRKPSRDSNRS